MRALDPLVVVVVVVVVIVVVVLKAEQCIRAFSSFGYNQVK